MSRATENINRQIDNEGNVIFNVQLTFPEWAGLPSTNGIVYGKSCFPKYRRPKIVKKGNKYKMVKQESFIKLSFMEKETKPMKNLFNRWVKFAGETHEQKK